MKRWGIRRKRKVVKKMNRTRKKTKAVEERARAQRLPVVDVARCHLFVVGG